jgi:flagellar M-ring protein FliF
MADPVARRQMLVFGGVFAAICCALGLGYFMFLRPDYVVLAGDLRPEDASAIVTELDKRTVAYRIEDGGRTIRVPADQVDATRVAIAGSDAAARGQIGFELFNKSDMGLTNFAQKINFQRALQGELVRTITALDGVETARVHLAIPERSLFRGERTMPSAAVTVAMKQGRIADSARVAGIQRLVAAAVPDLPEARVTVLDAQGRVISASAASEAPRELDERQAIQAYYVARVRNAVEPILGVGQFEVRALVQSATGTIAPENDPTRATGRSFGLRMTITTPSTLPDPEGRAARDAATAAIDADPARGDSIEFQIGPIAAPAPLTPPVAAQRPVEAPLPTPLEPTNSLSLTAALPAWLWAALAVVAVAALGIGLARRRRQLSDAEHEAFAAKLQRQLAISQEGRDAEQR